jgi:hypothetical protein
MAVAIFLIGDLFRECALSSRTSAFDQERRLRRLTLLVAITHLPRRNWGTSIERPHPWRSYGCRVDLDDAADDGTLGDHVEIIFIPLA